MNPLTTGTGLLVAAAVPVVVIGWAILFSVEAAIRGPAWSHRHLGGVGSVLRVALALGIVAVLVVRPVWVGLGAAYPIGVALLVVASRRRQLAAVEREMGFGEVQPVVREHLLARLRRGLIIVGLLSLVLGGALASVGVFQGWLVGAVGPIAGLALLRSRPGRVGSALPPSL